jgi:acetyl esterase/lipase
MSDQFRKVDKGKPIASIFRQRTCSMTLEIRTFLDVPVTRVPTADGERELVLDLYLPQKTTGPLPLVIYIHGGGWKQGTQYRPPFKPRLFDEGIAVAAITYRFSQEAPFPACLEDCKLMTRWLRAHAGTYNLDPARFALWGISAGGHLASLMAATQHLPEYEGDGGWNNCDSSVLAVCNTCGPTDLQRTFTDPVPGEGMVEMCTALLGGSPQEIDQKAALASPVHHVGSTTPPHLIIHGEDDRVVPAYHATDFHQRLESVGVASECLLLDGTGHSIAPEQLDEPVRAFLCRHLLR